jgi:prepilin peptidase CpaA
LNISLVLVAEVARWAIAMGLTIVLAIAGLTDVRTRRIPNWTVLTCLGLFLGWAAVHPLNWDLWALGAGVIAFAVSFGLYSVGVMGAGDSKLFAAVALFTGMNGLIPLAVVTALVGGVVAGVGLVMRPTRALTMINMKGKGDFGPGVPYGVAIAAAAAGLVWASLLHLTILPGLA